MMTGGKIGGDSYVGRIQDAPWLKQRLSTYETIQERRRAERATKTPVAIAVTLPDGKVVETTKTGEPLQSWISTPYDVACAISQGLADASSVARVTYASFVSDYSLYEDGMDGADVMLEEEEEHQQQEETKADERVYLWDMTRPLVGTVSNIEFLKFDQDPEAKEVFWHSSAHLMGEALEHVLGAKLTIGPPLAGGFYYDSYMGQETLKDEDGTYIRRVANVSSHTRFVFV